MVTAIKRDKRAENFAKKALMLGLDTKKQCDLLNEMYAGAVTFSMDGITETGKIHIVGIRDDIDILELPEVENFATDHFMPYRHNVKTLKLPSTFEKIDTNMYWVHSVQRIFTYDTTKVITENGADLIGHGSVLEAIFVQSTHGKKATIYKFK